MGWYATGSGDHPCPEVVQTVAETQMTKPLTVRELLAKQVMTEIPRGPNLNTLQPTTLRSPTAREGSTMETGAQEPTAVDTEV